MIFLLLISGYLTLKPLVVTEKPEGSLISDILVKKKDFPLFAFPITETTTLLLSFCAS